MKRLLALGGIALAAWLAALEFHGERELRGLRARLARLECAPSVAPSEVGELSQELARVRGELESTRARLAADRTAERLGETMALHEVALASSDCELALQRERLDRWEMLWTGREPATFEREVEALRGGFEQRWSDLSDLTARSARAAQAERERLERLIEPLTREPDPVAMWRELVGPVVQLSGDSTVGSGVLIAPRTSGAASGTAPYLLTSWHVVRDIYGSTERTSAPVPVKLYEIDGTTRMLEAHMLAYDVPLDVALLELDGSAAHLTGAQLASFERLREVRVFDPVYAVGCPLGNDPIPTSGAIAATEHVVDGCTYWMISAPTYIGNSGGGIYDARTHELLGIFSKIYTHGASRSTIVPHMGLVTPLSTIYDWLERTGHASLLLEPALAEPQTAAVQR